MHICIVQFNIYISAYLKSDMDDACVLDHTFEKATSDSTMVSRLDCCLTNPKNEVDLDIFESWRETKEAEVVGGAYSPIESDLENDLCSQRNGFPPVAYTGAVCIEAA